MIEGESDEIVMEVEMQFDGNPSIVLDIKTKVGVSLPIQVIASFTVNEIYHLIAIINYHQFNTTFFIFLFQVKNIRFTGVFRIIFKPLVDEFPCFGALCYSLREKVILKHLFLHCSLENVLKTDHGQISSLLRFIRCHTFLFLPAEKS